MPSFHVIVEKSEIRGVVSLAEVAQQDFFLKKQDSNSVLTPKFMLF